MKKLDFLRAAVLLFILSGILFFYLNLFTPSRLPKLLRLGTLNKSYNILVLGTDLFINAETREIKPGRTDSMVLLRYDSKKAKIYALSIPRDSYVEIPGYGMQKINSAYVLGGMPLVKETTEHLTGRKVDRYIILNSELLVKAVDLVGGIDVYVDKDMYYVDTAQNFKINLKKGYRHLSGKEANQFIRFRMDTMGDLTRVGRQQIFLKALFKKFGSPFQIIKAPLMLNILKENVQTDLSQKEIVLLLNTLRMLRWDDAETLMLPGHTRDDDPGNYFIDHAEIGRIMRQYF